VRNPGDWVSVLPGTQVIQIGFGKAPKPGSSWYFQKVEGVLTRVTAILLLPPGDFPKIMWDALVDEATRICDDKVFVKLHPNHSNYPGFFASTKRFKSDRFPILEFTEEFEIFSEKYRLDYLLGLTSSAMRFHLMRGFGTEIKSISGVLSNFSQHPDYRIRKLAEQELTQNDLWNS
jgi:hypothetical protein